MAMDSQPPPLKDKELCFFDETNPRSLINLVPDFLAHQLKLLWKGPDGYLLGLSEYDLFKECRNKGRQPQAIDNVLRLKFWTEYDRIQTTGEPRFMMVNVLGRLISRESFMKYYVVDHKQLAWLVTPSLDYQKTMEECLAFGIMKMRQLFEETDFNLTTDRRIEKFLMAFRMLDERVNGIKVIPGRLPALGSKVARAPTPEEKEEVVAAIEGTIERDIDAEIKARVDRIHRIRAENLMKENNIDGKIR